VPEVTPVIKQVINERNTITPSEYADHMELSIAQLETVTLMLSVLDKTDGGSALTE
jgi:hypothetical protein